MTIGSHIGLVVLAATVLAGCGAEAPRNPTAPLGRERVQADRSSSGTVDRRVSERERLLARDYGVFAVPRVKDNLSRTIGSSNTPWGRTYPTEARRLASASQRSAWLVPAARGLCLVMATGSGRSKNIATTCASRADARRGGLHFVRPGAPVVIAGVVSDAVASVSTVGRGAIRVPAQRNMYTISVRSGRALQLLNRAGQPVGRLSLPDALFDEGPTAPRPPAAPPQGPPSMLAP